MPATRRKTIEPEPPTRTLSNNTSPSRQHPIHLRLQHRRRPQQPTHTLIIQAINQRWKRTLGPARLEPSKRIRDNSRRVTYLLRNQIRAPIISHESNLCSPNALLLATSRPIEIMGVTHRLEDLFPDQVMDLIAVNRSCRAHRRRQTPTCAYALRLELSARRCR